jgi:hypothetical protein
MDLSCGGILPGGQHGTNDVAALMVGGGVGIKLSGKATLALWGDLLSDDDDEILA